MGAAVVRGDEHDVPDREREQAVGGDQSPPRRRARAPLGRAGRRVRAEPAPGPRRRAGSGRNDPPTPKPTARLLLARPVRHERSARRATRLRPARTGGRRDHQRHRPGGRRRRPRRDLARSTRPRGSGRQPRSWQPSRGGPRPGRAPRSSSRSTRPPSPSWAITWPGSPPQGRSRPAWNRVPVDRAVPDLRGSRRRADDRRRKRPGLSGPRARRRAAGARRRTRATRRTSCASPRARRLPRPSPNRSHASRANTGSSSSRPHMCPRHRSRMPPKSAGHPQTAALGLLPDLGGLPIARLPFSVDGVAVDASLGSPGARQRY